MAGPQNTRALEPSMVCIKNLLLGMNCFFVLTGLLLIAVGSTIKGLYTNFDKLLGTSIVSPASFMIAIGVIILFVSLFGCVGAVKQSTCLINLYTICLVVIFIFEFSAVIAGFALNATIQDTLTSNMKEAIHNKYAGEDTSMFDAVETIQENLQCCGADSPADWEGILDGSTGSNSSIQDGCVIVPDSCCGSWNSTVEPKECLEPFTEGCLPTLIMLAHDGSLMITGMAITVALIQCLGIYLSNELAKAIRRAKSIRAMRQMEIRNTIADSYLPMSQAKPTPEPTPVVYLANSHDMTA